MSSDNQNALVFVCTECGKRLRSKTELAGKSIKCPACGTPQTVPNARKDKIPASKTSKLEELELNLSEPAIDDLNNRQQAAEEIRAVKEQKRQLKRNREANRNADENYFLRRKATTTDSSAAAAASGASPPPKQNRDVKSIFDDELDLDELRLEPEVEVPKKKSIPSLDVNKAPLSTVNLQDLNDLVPEPGAAQDLPELSEEEVEETPEYRITCRVCGTAQYVSTAATGMKIQCPDCHSDFKVPPPPANWNPRAKKKKSTSIPAGFGYVPEPSREDDIGAARQKQRTAAILEKAKGEISEEEEDRLYDSDFDTAGFVQATFGFLRDPLTLVQVIVYGLVFACLFGFMSFSLNDTNSQFGRGLLLISVIAIPLIGILFTLPMLSGCLTLIENVANKQQKANEVPAFNIFENFADLLVLVVALLESIIPGFVIGRLFGDESSSYLFGVGGMIISGFVLFPYFLLSTMDNGNLLNPISASVTRSISEAKEAWGGYYLKTFVATAVLLVSWLILLGRSPALAAVAGGLLPCYLFFTCQQIGTLADQIADCLSFDFTPSKAEADEDESGQAEF
ncbi:MAG: hypothetical protein NXI32_22530 [bacterium]|nr:hypothetical protein [bacterium]